MIDFHAFADELGKIAGSRLRQATKLVEEVAEQGKKYRLIVAGKPAGEMHLKSTGQVEWSKIDPKYQGLGLGKKMYGEVMRRQPGQKLQSDDILSTESTRLWRSLKKNPKYNVQEGKTVPGSPGALVSTRKSFDELPPFTASLPAKAAING